MFRLLAATLIVLASTLVPPMALRPAAAGDAVQAGMCTSREGPGIAPPAKVPAGIPGFHAAWFGQSSYSSLCPGARSIATVAFYNSGSQGWVSGRMGEVAYLGTWGPEPGQARARGLGCDGQSCSQAPC